MSDFTVIAWCTPDYRHLSAGLAADCQRLGYPFHLYEVDQTYLSLTSAWCNHPWFIRQGVLDHGRVLFLDVECRILRPIPETWRAPLVTTRSPKAPFWLDYNTGTVMMDENSLDFLDLWLHMTKRWDLGNLPENAHVFWPNDICEELSFNAAATALEHLGSFDLMRVALEYIDRETTAPVVRGMWSNPHTVIQHPTLHHWPKTADAVAAKKLLIQNFQAPEQAPALMARAQPVEAHGWRFDGPAGTYHPLDYPEHPRPWLDDFASPWRMGKQ